MGAGLPFFISKINYSDSDGEIFLGENKLNFFVEIPEIFTFKKNPDFMISSGLSYIYFNETQSGGGLGGGSYAKHHRSALSLYMKFQYKSEISFIERNNWNFGIVTGKYLFTHDMGEREWWSLAKDRHYYGSEEINTNSKSFFGSFYFGFTTSFQFNFERIKFSKPAIEFSFYPDYANIFDHYSGDNRYVSHNMLMTSVIFGFGTKKAAL